MSTTSPSPRQLPGRPAAPARPGPLSGFEVLGELGRGRRTVAYRVRRGSEQYALKLLDSRLPGDDPEESFRREAALLACVDHPGLARVHEVGAIDGRPYIVMDLVEGRSLAEVLGRGPLPLDQVAAIGADVAETLAAAHRAGLVHRDIKPDNLVVGPDGTTRVLDLSLAARTGDAATAAATGTMLYCAPEQAGMFHRPVDGRADLYSLGAVLYECATGVTPFVVSDVGELLRLHASAPVPDPRAARPEVPAALAAVITRLLAKDPDDRYQTGAGVASDLRRLAAGAGDDDVPGAEDDTGTRTTDQLFGRDAELIQLAARWERAEAGEGGAALVLGASGGGKSALARAALAAVAARGALVLSAKSDPDGAVPMAPLRDAIEAHVDHVQALPARDRREAIERLATAAGPAAALLRRLSPGLGRLLDAPELIDDGGDQRFAAAVSGFVAALARAAGGLVLFLDDAQWLDDATRRVLLQLATEIGSTPLLLLATARDDAACAETVAALRAGLGAALDLTVTLGPLPPEAVRELVASVTGNLGVDGDTAGRLAARSGGNPLALKEYVAAIVDAGLLVPHWGRWQLDADGLQTLDLPTDAVALILKRLERLEPGARQALAVGAVIGAQFDPGLVAEVCDLDRARIHEATTAGVWQHLVEPRDGDRFGFLHDRIREALIAQFGEDERRALHGRVADVLDGRSSGGASVYALAGHCLAGDPDREPGRTLRACRAAARLAIADQAPDEALGFLAGAMDAARRAGIEPDSDLLQLIGLAQHRAGRFDDAVESLDHALAVTADPTERARILALMALVHDATWNTLEQAATVERALAELGHPLPRNAATLVSTAGLFAAGCAIGLTGIARGAMSDQQRESYRLRAALSFAGQLAYTRELQPTRAMVYALRDVFVVSRLGAGPEVARSRIGSAHLARAVGLKRTSRRVSASARQAAAATGDPRVQAYVEWLISVDRYFFGVDQGESARRTYAEHRRWLEVGQAQDLLLCLLWDAFMRGHTADVMGLYEQRRQLVAASGQAGRMTTHITDALWHSRQGRLPDAFNCLDGMRAQDEDLLLWKRVDIVWGTLMVCVEHDELGDRFDAAVAEFEGLGLRPIDLVPIQKALYLYRAHGRIAQYRAASGAERALRLGQARAAMKVVAKVAVTPLQRAHHQLARVALLEAQGRPAEALRELGRAEPTLHAVDAPALSMEAARVRALALTATGAGGEAGRQARQAVALAAEQGWSHRARRLAVELDVSHSAGHRAGRPQSGDGAADGVYRLRLDAIEQVSRAASRVLDPAKIATLALDETVRILGAERAFLFLTEGGGTDVVPFGGRDAAGNDLSELTAYSATLVERVRQDGEALVVTGTDEGEALGAASAVLHGLRSIMVAPVVLDGRLLGVVYLDSRVAKGIFTMDDVGTLAAIINHVAVALETARAAQLDLAVAAANDRRDVAETMRDGLAALTGSLEPDEVLRRLLDSVFDVVGGRHAWMVLPTGDASSPVRVLEIGAGAVDELLDPDEPLRALLGTVAPQLGDGAAARPALVSDLVGSVGSWMAVPLRVRDEHLGVFLAADPGEHAYGEDRVEIAAALIDQGMVAYESAQLFVRVQELAATDGLTGLANRRHFFELAERQVARTHRRGGSLAAMMIDVDHFKAVNDRHGHRAGDEVLAEVAVRLRGAGRAEDVIGRYGGEEFAVLVADFPGRARIAAERLRTAVAESAIATSAGPVTISVSIGIAEMQEGDDVNTLLARADRHLYEAKRSGRNRIQDGVRQV